ncbi:Fcf1-domain-containing protein [Ceraceosorus guamensis]|uniref:Fcf1-domain-containing protein n=1 Tax=Ceraceosorus guamensis TaxID=1522189 RepID=A0A316W4A7_9BASI|nr:Fcf1-domain-containing protein [Ceraceosorus guamensis]PWN43461.1 Fcf1-domain-containing protein [Ceraceosorus guamensis]
MGKRKQIKKLGAVKRIMNPAAKQQAVQSAAKADAKGKGKGKVASGSGAPGEGPARRLQPASSALFFNHNESLGPPYRVLVDTNFINFSLQNKLELVQGMMDCLYAEAIPCITSCVIAELEKLGTKYRMALRVARDPRFERLPCSHKGTYADDCIVDRVSTHKCFMVATCDRELRRRIRRIPGIPLMYIAKRQYRVERLPDQGMPS